MSEIRKLTQRELSVDLQMSESEVARFIASNEPMADGAGHWVYFSLNAEIPKGLLSRLGVDSDRRLPLYRPSSAHR
jgi:hypothetical protein